MRLSCCGYDGDRHGLETRATDWLLRVFVVAIFVLSFRSTVNAQTPWPATDALGRTLPLSDEVGPPRANRFVGIFYFAWHNGAGAKRADEHGPYDISRILKSDPDAMNHPSSPLWGPVGVYHYWGEPLYGYYRANDPWVLRRHAILLADAGIDTLIIDATNADTYYDVYPRLCQVFEQIRREGDRTPQIAFIVNSDAGKTAEKLLREFYSKGDYRDLWFMWEGKPLLICDPKEASDELRKFFTLRKAHWPFELKDTAYAWHWENTYPQNYSYTYDATRPEEVNVSVAQNLRVVDGKATSMSTMQARGRSFHDGKQQVTPGSVDRGLNFQEQWERALNLSPPFVFVTGWNEWIAGRWGDPKEPPIFVDQFTKEFSRDIEPMKGGFGDNYYLQLVANVRRYKGAPPIPLASAKKTIRIQDSFEQWREVSPEFRDHVNETIARDHDGVAGTHYRNDSGRNDFVACKVARDDANFYFYVKTRLPITPASGPNWMWLLIDADCNHATGWEGFDYLLDGSIKKNAGGWTWETIAPINRRVEGNEMQLAVPRSLIKGERFDFKWADNLQRPGDVMDFYVSGDVAPEGRLVYRFQTKP